MRWLVAGASGMLGKDLVQHLSERGERVTGLRHRQLDVTDPAACVAAVQGSDVVVNCAAYTAVDLAEEEQAAAFAVNAVGAANLARAARAAGALLVHISTDYVFDGEAATPYPEDAPLSPRSAYGRSKAAGEWAVRAETEDVLVLRTAWLYGTEGTCFPRTIARLAEERDELTVVDDQVGQPTWTVDVARYLVDLVRTGVRSGTYHCTSAGQTSWFDFAAAVLASTRSSVLLRPIATAELDRPAPRPHYSVLGADRSLVPGVAPIDNWRTRWEVAAPAVVGAATPLVTPRAG